MMAFFHVLPGTGAWYSDAVMDGVLLFDILWFLYFAKAIFSSLKAYWHYVYEEELRKKNGA